MVVFAMGLMLNSCETTDLDLRDNPNALTSADPDLLLNSIQFSSGTTPTRSPPTSREPLVQESGMRFLTT